MIYLVVGDAVMAYIKGVFIQSIYVNPSNLYMVGLFRVKESSDNLYINKVITFTGTIEELKYKTMYKFEGNFVLHNKYGMQFQVDSYEVILPTEEEEIIEFLSSDLFPIGEKTAEKIVNKLGCNALKIIVEEPNCLKDIPRLTAEKIEKIVDTLSNYENTSKMMIELGKMGFNTKNALSIIKKYGDNTKKIIEDNIYAIDINKEISFLELDKIAINNGYELNDERRLEALTIYLFNSLTFNTGDTYLYFDEIYTYIKKDTNNLSREDFEYILIKLAKMNLIVIDKDRYYLKELRDAENYISSRIVRLNNLEKRKMPKLDKKLRQLEMIMGISYDEKQKEAIYKAINNNLTIITGGPGTGKTTIVRCIVKLLIEINGLDSSKLALLAPTGRAARKLMDTTGMPAYTIHKYLGWDKDTGEFEVNEYCPNRESYIIVDESSMIDTMLMASLLKGITSKAKIILVGDYYQLPSVSQGQVLKDLIESDVIDVVRLNLIYRQSEDSYIRTLAYEVKNGMISESIMSKYDDYNFVVCPSDSVLKMVSNIVKKAMDKGYTERDIQVLAPIYKTTSGIDSLNKELQDIFNPKDPNKNEIISGDVIYREGDKVLQLVNDSDNSISNGDIGYIEAINVNSKNKEIVINFDGTIVTYTPKDFINITHGYAISVHKSQGGEFKMVIMPIVPAFKRMLYNKLIYTAITRAKEKLILLGEPDSFIYGVNNNYVDNRKTSLKELLIQKYN